ncbi:MAG: endonuclease/exonuclease/phosphatase family protein [Pseudomonadota bacterium]
MQRVADQIRRRWGVGALAFTILVACGSPTPQEPLSFAPVPDATPAKPDGALRVATFNVALYNPDRAGGLIAELELDNHRRTDAIKAIIDSVNPDILVVNEIDYDPDGRALDLFADLIDGGYGYRFALPSNTGVASWVDLDGDGRNDHAPGSQEYGNDAFGFGRFPGQYAFGVVSRFPINEAAIRTFQNFLWKDLPDNLMPTDFYSEDAQEIFRLSSKTHADVPIDINGQTLHFVLAHPTPPGFDGREDRNGRRNHDEIRLLHDYITDHDATWLIDDNGMSGGLSSDAFFVIAGDLNADPVDGDRVDGVSRHAIADLIGSSRVVDPQPHSTGGSDAAYEQGDANLGHDGDHTLDTGDFSDQRVGNLRVDYVLPSSNLEVLASGTFWPAPGEPGFELVGPGYPVVSSDHRLVWVDIRLPE